MIEPTTWPCAKCGTMFRPSKGQRREASAAKRSGATRRAYCSPECHAAAHPCMVCVHPRVSEIDALICTGENPAEIIKVMGLNGFHPNNIALHRLRHVSGRGQKRRPGAKGRCLVCLDEQVNEVDRLVRIGLGPEEIVSALSLSYPAVCVGRHRRKCMGIPGPLERFVRKCREINTALGYHGRPHARTITTGRASLTGLTAEEKRVRHNQMVQARARALRLRVIAEYGGACACCGEAREPFLCLDHADGTGAAHRKELTGDWSRGAGSRTYRWIQANGFPKEGFRILCHNCNCAIGMRGACPHELERTSPATRDA